MKNMVFWAVTPCGSVEAFDPENSGSSTLKTEAIGSSEEAVEFYQIT
jgi:hypothetical protein